MKFKIRYERIHGIWTYHVLQKSWLGYKPVASFSSLAEANKYIADNE